jgi:hypothetical protein
LRKQIFINKSFQLQFAATLIIPIIIIDLCFWAAIEYNFNLLANEALADGLDKGHHFFILLNYQKAKFLKTLIGVSIFVSVIMIVWGIYLSHKIAGPLTKFEMMLMEYKSLSEARDNKVTFRKNDFFQSLPQVFNDFIQRISK